jgi:hypothetical protein
VHVLLLPRPEPWSVGAEPAANWDTMLQLVVTRPPTTVEDAFEVARCMTLLWPNTNSGLGVTVREMAFDLVGRSRWFLHCRP